MTQRNWIVLALFCVAAPFVFVYVQALWALLLVPSLKLTAIKSGLALKLFMLLFGCVGAVAAAVLLTTPLAWLVRARPALLATAVSAVTCFVVLVLFDTSWVASPTLAVIALAEQLAFFLASLGAAILVFRKRSAGHA
jgi:hypothetical protein